MRKLGIESTDLVVCNLYPFAQMVTSGTSFEGCMEQIDAGSPTMVRAADKNHTSVTVMTSPAIYEKVVDAAKSEDFDLGERRILATEAFTHTSEYDTAMASWFSE